MKKILLFVSAVLAGATGYAQTVVPNGGFETWTSGNLDSWSDTLTVNTKANGAPNTSQYRTADSVLLDVNDGNKSIVVHSSVNTNFVGFGGPPIPIPGLMVSGANANVVIDNAVSYTVSPFAVEPVGTPTITMQGQIPFNNSKAPNGLKGYYKYKSDSTITGSIGVILFKGADTAAGTADLTKLSAATTLADSVDALVHTFAKTNTWTAFSITLQANILKGYSTIPATIDSARITAMSCTPGQILTNKSSAADSLFLDKLEFTYPVASSIESVDDAGFGVSQNAPNPTNGTTTIEVATPTAGAVQFTVVDILGTTVASQTLNAIPGNNTITFEAGSLASGTYFYTVSNGSSSSTKKLVVAK